MLKRLHVGRMVAAQSLCARSAAFAHRLHARRQVDPLCESGPSFVERRHRHQSRLQGLVDDKLTGSLRRLTSGLAEESGTAGSRCRMGAHIAYTFPRDGQTRNEVHAVRGAHCRCATASMLPTRWTAPSAARHGCLTASRLCSPATTRRTARWLRNPLARQSHAASMVALPQRRLLESTSARMELSPSRRRTTAMLRSSTTLRMLRRCALWS